MRNLISKLIMNNSHTLTNRDISNNYKGETFYLMRGDFVGAFAYWATRQDQTGSYYAVADAVRAYDVFLSSQIFPSIDTVVRMDYDSIASWTDTSHFETIPEILRLNQLKPDFVDLGALSRNVFYHILREQITQKQ